MDISVWLYFFIACLGVALTPGPNAVLVMTHSVKFGSASAVYTVLGGLTAFAILISISVFGLDALLHAFPALVIYMKLGGGIYLIWLGLQQWKLRRKNEQAAEENATNSGKALLFAQGAASALSNPKVFLFFGAFLTPFIDPARSTVLQFAVMAVTFSIAEFIVEMSICLMASRFRTFLTLHGSIFSEICGTLFIIIGGVVLFSGI